MLKLTKIIGFKEIKTLVFGSFSSLMINIVALFFYSRLYSIEQFGIFALFVSIITIGSIIATFRINDLIVLQKTKKEAAFFSVLCNWLVLRFSLVVLFFAIILYVFSILFFQSSKIIWLLIPLSIYCFSNVNTFISWNNKIKKYNVISIFRFVQAFTVAFVSILLGYFKIELGLIIGQTIGIFISSSYLMVLFYKSTVVYKFKKNTFSELKVIFRNNKDIINYSYGLAVVLKLTQAIPNFILNSFFGSSIVGVFDMTIKILNIPRVLISNNIGEIYYQKATVFHHRKNIKFNKITMDTSGFLLISGAFIYLPFVLFGKDLFSLFLGQSWALSGELSEIIAFWYFLIFITSPMAYIYYIFRNLNKLFWFCSFSLLIKITVCFFIATTQSAMSTLYYYSYICIILEFLLLLFIFYSYKKKANLFIL